MNSAEKKLIEIIKDIDYGYVEKNMSANEKAGYAYERIIAERLSENGLDNLREMVIQTGVVSRGPRKGEDKYEAWKIPAPIIRQVRILGNVQSVSEIMPDNSFKLAPFGERSPVDILIKLDGTVIALECKSVKTEKGIPEWNDNPPKADFLYAFIRKGMDKPVFKLGSEIISKTDRADLIDLALLYQSLNDSETVEEFESIMESIKEIKFAKNTQNTSRTL
jgi:hypothetical protein